MYKVFIDNREVRFVELTVKKNKKRFLKVLFSEVNTYGKLASKLNELTDKQVLLVACSDVDKAFDKVFRAHQKMTTAGGVVQRKSRILAIYRLGKWDFPKGKLEPGEIPEIAAYREIEEECGIHGHVLLNKICETYHTYEEKGKKILKRNHWFQFVYTGPKKLIPQTEEDISEALWLKKSKLKRFEANTYASILSVLNDWKKKFG
jgi:8-oxo-dGTP pyrophosphatase MutT (NUDIX family)